MKAAAETVLRFLLVAGCLVAAVYTALLVRATQLFTRNTASSVAEAVRLEPYNAAFLDALAEWQPQNRKQLLERSVHSNPFDYEAWIRLGILAEMQDNNLAEAQRCYSQAARVNRMFSPRWTLANFYFRHQDPAKFFHWSRRALEITPYSPNPVFAQMWAMTNNQQTLNAAIPNRPRILLQYISFLADTQRFDCVPSVLDRLVHAVPKETASSWGRNDLLASAQDRMLAAGYRQPALATWNLLNKASWIKPSAPDDHFPITNGNFRDCFYAHGFDWLIIENPGVRAEQLPSVPSIDIKFEGEEAENLALLQQYIPLAPDARYSLVWTLRSKDIAAPSGLFWHLHAVNGTAELTSGDLLDSSSQWIFKSPAQSNLFLLTLRYHRPSGALRANGRLVLKSVEMKRE